VIPLYVTIAATALVVPLWSAAPVLAQTAQASAPVANRNAPSVTVVKAMRDVITDTVVVSGTLTALEEVLVAAQIDGLATVEILVEEGDTVKAGQVLARLNRETIDAAIAQNKAQLARSDASIASARSQIAEAEAGVAQAQASFQRTRSLRTEGIASAETFDQRQAAALQAAAKVNAAREALRLAQADKALAEAQRDEQMIRSGRTEIKAPVGGIISRRTARIGAIAGGAADPLFRIIKDGAIELEADISETTLSRIAIGQKSLVRPAGYENDLPAVVRLISAEINRTSRLGRVRLRLEKPQGLVVGSFARGTVETARREAVIIPLAAVQFNTEGAQVQVVNNNVVESRNVKTGIRSAGRIEITDGLKDGEIIVNIAGTFLRNGDSVTPVMQ
jgi:HlyD family secretion protein